MEWAKSATIAWRRAAQYTTACRVRRNHQRPSALLRVWPAHLHPERAHLVVVELIAVAAVTQRVVGVFVAVVGALTDGVVRDWRVKLEEELGEVATRPVVASRHPTEHGGTADRERVDDLVGMVGNDVAELGGEGHALLLRVGGDARSVEAGRELVDVQRQCPQSRVEGRSALLKAALVGAALAQSVEDGRG